MKIFLFSKMKLFFLSAAFAMLIMGLVWAYCHASGSARQIPIYCVDRDDMAISLTFDCAWNDNDINDIIEVLGKYNCKSTFFVVGDWAIKYQDAVKALSDAGHEIANHSFDHAHYARLDKAKMKEDMDKCDKVIENLIFKRTNLFRAPYGEYNNEVVRACTETGRYCIQWDVDSLDWKELSEKEIANRVILKTKGGSIILLHNGTPNTCKALNLLLPDLAGKGFVFMPVSQLIYKENYAIDHTGKQILSSPR